MDLQAKHIELVEAVNNTKTEVEHREADLRLEGYRIALEVLSPRFSGYGLMDCDAHYLTQGIDRPMCCGVFLDWQPS